MLESEEKKGISGFITKKTRYRIREHRKSTERFKYRDGWRVESSDDVINRALDALDTLEKTGAKDWTDSDYSSLDEKSSPESNQGIGVE